jgi:hypothetical protein
MATKDTTAAPCPNCGKKASGRFCSNCGATLTGITCASCDAPLAPGVKFCHRCGAPAGAGAVAPAAPAPEPAEPRGLADILPWAVAGVALVALVVMLLAQRGRGDAPAVQGSAMGAAGAPGAPMAGGGGGSGGSGFFSMTPEQRAQALFDRIVRYEEQGKQDSLQFFAPMAEQAYRMLGDPNAHARFDLGRVLSAAGKDAAALAEADTILSAEPNNLLGLTLGIRAARRLRNEERARELERRLAAAADAELARGIPEYDGHRAEIDEAVTAAKEKP